VDLRGFWHRQFDKLRPKGATSETEADAITSKALNDFVQSVLDEVSDHRHGAFSFGHGRQLSKAFELNEVRRDSR
jgi:hypothetical protein